MYSYHENIIELCSLSYISNMSTSSKGERSYKCTKYKNTTDGMCHSILSEALKHPIEVVEVSAIFFLPHTP